jgi:hypothetical protein
MADSPPSDNLAPPVTVLKQLGPSIVLGHIRASIVGAFEAGCRAGLFPEGATLASECRRMAQLQDEGAAALWSNLSSGSDVWAHLLFDAACAAWMAEDCESWEAEAKFLGGPGAAERLRLAQAAERFLSGAIAGAGLQAGTLTAEAFSELQADRARGRHKHSDALKPEAVARFKAREWHSKAEAAARLLPSLMQWWADAYPGVAFPLKVERAEKTLAEWFSKAGEPPPAG